MNLSKFLLQIECNFGTKKDPTLQLMQVFLLCYRKVKGNLLRLNSMIQERMPGNAFQLYCR